MKPNTPYLFPGGRGLVEVAPEAPAAKPCVVVKNHSLSLVDECELAVWRSLRARLDQAVCSLLAGLGDDAPRDLIKLQHDLVEIGKAPFGGGRKS